MPKQRNNYPVDAVYVGPSPATGIMYTTGLYGLVTGQTATASRVRQLVRVQSADYSFNVARQDVNQFGELPAIDRVILEQPTVSMNFSYLLSSFANENRLGFTISSGVYVSAISGILTKVEDEKNYFIKTVAEGNDANGYTDTSAANNTVLGLGNGFITSYSSEGSVGNFPTVSVGIEALNMKIDYGTGSLQGPAVFPTDGTPVTGWYYGIPMGASNPNGVTAGDLATSVLRPGDITVSLGTYDDLGAKISDAKIQSYNISFDLSRESLQKLGSKYAYSKEITFPVTLNASVTALVGDLQSGNFVNTINADNSYNMSVTVNKPGTTVPQLQYVVRGVKLDSQEFSSSIGANKSVTLNFSTQLGSAQATGVGLFLSGSN